MPQSKTKTLNIIDIIALTVIFFGIAIWQSVSTYVSSFNAGEAISFDMNTITDQMQWMSIAQEIILLGIAVLYLWLRKFDFKVLKFQVNKWTIPLIIALIIGGAAASDLGMLVTEAISPQTESAISATTSEAAQYAVDQNATVLPQITLLAVLFALLNGFFEEVFFLGLVFAVDKRSLPWALLLSVLVRFSFHIYQGIPAAIGITCMGLIFMSARMKIKSLTPFTLAHSFFDIFGLSLLFWFF